MALPSSTLISRTDFVESPTKTDRVEQPATNAAKNAMNNERIMQHRRVGQQ
jgi:hypothetical protein